MAKSGAVVFGIAENGKVITDNMSDPLREKSYAFARRIVKLSEYLHKEKQEFVLSKKILDSGTNIGLRKESRGTIARISD